MYMETQYTAYARTVNGVIFYFVKSFQTFPELKNVAPLLQGYGMHRDFKKACRIANVFEKEIQQELLAKMQNDSSSARVLPLYPAVAEIYSMTRKPALFPSLMRLLGIG